MTDNIHDDDIDSDVESGVPALEEPPNTDAEDDEAGDDADPDD
jgi:hypothetical protein